MLKREGLAGLEVLVTAIGDDADALTSRELATLESQLPARRAASGAARRAARLLCSRFGVNAPQIPRTPRGRPTWPAGLVGSMSHDAKFAAAAVGRARWFKGVGIDIEPAEALPAHVGPVIGTVAERRQFAAYPFADKALFSIKEAVFKAASVEDVPALDFHDLTVDLRSRTANTMGHGSVDWRLITDPFLLAIAWRPAAARDR